MMKKVAKLLIVVMAVGMLAGCGDGGNDNTSQSVSDIDLDKYVTKLGEYKGLELTGTREVITDEYVESYIDYMLANSQEPVAVTRAAQEGDVVNIDFVGKRDGVEFEGGSGQAYDLELGSGQFIPGFEEGLIGVNTGDVVDLDVTFPEEYTPNPDLAGVAVVFTVTVNSISEMQTPELNEEYVKSLAIEGCETIDQFKVVVRESLESNAEATFQNDLQTAAMDKLMELCEFAEEAPAGVVEYYRNMIVENFQNQASSMGMEVMDFVTQYYGMTEEEYNAELDAGAITSAQQAMVCMMIAQKEGLVATDDELNAAIEQNYANFGYESVEAYKEQANVEDYREYLTTTNVLKFLVANAVITDEAQATTETQTETTEEATTEAATTEAE